MSTEVRSEGREAAGAAKIAETNGAARRPMQEDDLLRFVWIADPQISPDGTRTVFTRVWVDAEADEYRSQLWMAGPGVEQPRALTSGRYDTQARWSPDGRWIAFVRKPESGKPGQIHVLPVDGGEATAITSLEGGASNPSWSPDSLRLAFSSSHNPALDGPDHKKPKHEPGRVVTKPVFRENDLGFHDDRHRDHVWVIGRDGGTPRQLTTGTFAESGPRWSRDGSWIYFVADRRAEPWFGPEESKLWAVSPELEEPTEGEALELVVDSPGGIVAWTEAEDGGIVIITSRYEGPRSYEQPELWLARGPWPRRELERLAASHDFPFGEAINSDQHPPRGGGEVPLAFTPDGAVVTRVGQHGSSQLVEVRGDRVTELTPPGHDLIAGTASADRSTWALTLGDPLTPGDLVRFEPLARRHEVVHRANPWLDEIALGEVEDLWYDSFDGTRIQAWVVKPPGAARGAATDGSSGAPHPLVLEIHGGPHTAYGYGFFHEFHVLAGQGYVVLAPNPRGSTTYGQEFANVIQYRFPGDDAKDLLAGVDALVARGLVDAKRLGVTGGSGGGLLTNWLVTQTDRFGAAVTQRCVSDWAGFYYSADFAMFTPFWFRKPPFEDPEDYRDRSPVTFASRITTPLMVIHSEEDWRTPIGQGEAMFRALKQQRKPTVMVRFPGESHELSRSGVPSRRVQNQQHIRRWFDRWLLGKPAPEYGV